MYYNNYTKTDMGIKNIKLYLIIKKIINSSHFTPINKVFKDIKDEKNYYNNYFYNNNAVNYKNKSNKNIIGNNIKINNDINFNNNINYISIIRDFNLKSF